MSASTTFLPLSEEDREALQIVANHDLTGITPEAFGPLMWTRAPANGVEGFLGRLRRAGLLTLRYTDNRVHHLSQEGRARLESTNARHPQHRVMPVAVLMARYAPSDDHPQNWQALFDWLWSAPPERMDSLAVDIQANGIRVPVALASDGRVQDGHRRLAVAITLGIHEVPIRFTHG